MHILHIMEGTTKTASIFFFMTLGENIKHYRKLVGLTQVQLAEKVGIQQYNLARYEKDVVAPSTELLPKLAKVLGVTLDTLFARKQTPEPAEQAPKRSLREEKIVDVFRELSPTHQRAILQQAEGLLLRNKK